MHKRTWKRWGVMLAAVLAVLALLAAARPVRSFAHALAVTCQFAGIRPIPIRVYWRLKERKVQVTEMTIPGSAGAIEVRAITPVGVDNPPVIVVVHGFSPEGMRENGIGAIGHDLAVDGFQVLVPNLPALQKMMIVPEVLMQIGDTAHWAHMKSGKKVALIGVSFGGGLSLRVASLPQYSQDLGTLFVLGGFNSVPRLCDFFTGRGALGPDGSIDRREPSGLGFPVMALQHLDEEVPPQDEALVAELTRKLVIAKSFTPAFRAEMAKYPEDVQKRFMQLITVTPEQEQRYQAIFNRHHAEYEYLSPHGHLGGLTAEAFIIHGRDDILIPPEEALWNQEELAAAHRTVHLSLTPWVNHRSLGGDTSLGDKYRFVSFIGQALDAFHRNA